jgi:hypothetical protein
MSALSEAVAEIEDFVKQFSADSFSNHAKAKARFSTAYKQLHAMLIWGLLIPEGEFPEKKFGVHPEEGLSDASQAFALLAFSLFKPSRVMARSGIENMVRVAVAHANGDYAVKSVYSLFDNADDAFKNDPITKPIISRLKALYGELCLTVHSAHEDHVALRIPFEKVFAFDEGQYLMTVGLLARTASGLNQLLYSLFSGSLQKLTHKNRDFVLDSLPKTLKRNVQA